jgi:hypothetical protein
MTRREFDAIKVKDQLGKPDNIGIFGPFKKTETLVIEELPLVVLTQSTEDMAIWDNPSTTWDGEDEDDKWDTYTQENQEISDVENTNAEFIWRFSYEDSFNDDGGYITFGFTDSDSTTATEDVDNQEVTFTAGQVWQSKSVFKDSSESQIVSSATLSVTSTSGVFAYEMSADGGDNWETVTLGEEHTFTNPGSDLRIRVTEDDSSTGTITVVRCQYNV